MLLVLSLDYYNRDERSLSPFSFLLFHCLFSSSNSIVEFTIRYANEMQPFLLYYLKTYRFTKVGASLCKNQMEYDSGLAIEMAKLDYLLVDDNHHDISF